jgi:hypothetical protein
VDSHGDPEIASTSERGTEWLNEGREMLIDELACQLSIVLGRRQPDQPSLEATVQNGATAGWPVEVLGFWIAALRLYGASWDDIGDLLGTSRQAAHRRFAPWARRYLPFVLVAIPGGRPPPAGRAETSTRLRESTELGADHLDATRQAIARAAHYGLNIAAEPPR